MHGTVSQTEPAAARHAARQAKPFAAPPQNVAWHHATYALKERWEGIRLYQQAQAGSAQGRTHDCINSQHGVLTILEQTVSSFFLREIFISRSTVHRMSSRAGMK